MLIVITMSTVVRVVGVQAWSLGKHGRADVLNAIFCRCVCAPFVPLRRRRRRAAACKAESSAARAPRLELPPRPPAKKELRFPNPCGMRHVHAHARMDYRPYI